MNEDDPPPPHRLLISTDAANEADDQFAIVQAPLTPTLDFRDVVEFNLIDDVAAANVVMESGIAVWQIPVPSFM
jgi:hypothetical protein